MRLAETPDIAGNPRAPPLGGWTFVNSGWSSCCVDVNWGVGVLRRYRGPSAREQQKRAMTAVGRRCEVIGLVSPASHW